ncbi:exodeoxyribonuclease VII small subunit [Candidatus Caldatribacterium saccharofermentans]|uniref:Exodeoxyribonuclease VII small subunit n=1 Tax=Candidatus Caldatribacterium saccharofermentans TaxID=1454753 RepID=A0A7V4TJ27_9BACT
MSSFENLTYREALAELQAIVQELEDGMVDIDLLVEKVRRASFLCQFLRQKLRTTEEEVQKILQETEHLTPEQ